MKTLPIRPITTEAFAPYGWVAAAGDHAGRPINDGTTLRVAVDAVTSKWLVEGYRYSSCD